MLWFMEGYLPCLSEELCVCMCVCARVHMYACTWIVPIYLVFPSFVSLFLELSNPPLLSWDFNC